MKSQSDTLEASQPEAPRVGSVAHFRHGPLAISLGHAPCTCLHTLVFRHEGAGKISLALATPQGWHIYHDVSYAPLPACDVSGTWHPADEHKEED